MARRVRRGEQPVGAGRGPAPAAGRTARRWRVDRHDLAHRLPFRRAGHDLRRRAVRSARRTRRRRRAQAVDRRAAVRQPGWRPGAGILRRRRDRRHHHRAVAVSLVPRRLAQFQLRVQGQARRREGRRPRARRALRAGRQRAPVAGRHPDLDAAGGRRDREPVVGGPLRLRRPVRPRRDVRRPGPHRRAGRRRHRAGTASNGVGAGGPAAAARRPQRLGPGASGRLVLPSGHPPDAPARTRTVSRSDPHRPRAARGAPVARPRERRPRRVRLERRSGRRPSRGRRCGAARDPARRAEPVCALRAGDRQRLRRPLRPGDPCRRAGNRMQPELRAGPPGARHGARVRRRRGGRGRPARARPAARSARPAEFRLERDPRVGAPVLGQSRPRARMRDPRDEDPARLATGARDRGLLPRETRRPRRGPSLRRADGSPRAAPGRRARTAQAAQSGVGRRGRRAAPGRALQNLRDNPNTQQQKAPPAKTATTSAISAAASAWRTRRTCTAPK